MSDREKQLFWACVRGDLGEVQRMLAVGVGVEWKEAGLQSWTPLLTSASQGRLDLVALLAETGANLDARSTSGRSALGLAAENGHYDVVRFLCETRENRHHIFEQRGGARKSNFEAVVSEDAILPAALNGHVDVCLCLISFAADARVVDARNYSALTHFGINAPRLSDAERQQGQEQVNSSWLTGPHPSHMKRRKSEELTRRFVLLLALKGCGLRAF